MTSHTAPVVRLGVAELEARFGVDRSTLWRWYRSGRLPEPEYIADRRTWRLDVIESWERDELARPASARRNNLRSGGAKP